MERLKVHHINIVILSLISILNIYTGIIQKMNIFYYLTYVLPFIISLFIYGFFRNFLIDALLFITAVPLSIFVGTWGNLTGIIFLCFAFYCLEDNKIMIICGFCTLITIISKMLIDENGTIIRTILYIAGYTYFFIIYYILIHPKKYNKLSTLNEDYVNVQILGMLITGHRSKEIADKINLSENAVIKRIKNMRIKYGCSNNEEMIYSLVKKGKIRLN